MKSNTPNVSKAAQLLCLAAFLLCTPAPAHGYITRPVPTLGHLCESTYVTEVVVEHVSKEKGIIIYKKVRDLKGKYPREQIKHIFDLKNTPQHKGPGDVPIRPDEKDWTYALQWAEPGKKAVVFALKYDPYGDFGHTYIDGCWYATMCPKRDWDWWYTIYTDPNLLYRWHCGTTARLVAAIETLLAGKETVVPVLVGGTKDDLRMGRGKLKGLKVSLKIRDHNPGRDLVDFVPVKEDAPVRKPVDPETIAAYQKLGAPYGWLLQLELGVMFEKGNRAVDFGVMPAFSFKNRPPGKLPDVNRPFGLEFQTETTMDVDLKELAGLRNLAYLHLRNVQVSDAGLRDLADSKSLAQLALHQIELTEAGFKELARFKNLSALHLDRSPVTDANLKNLAGLVNLTSLTLGNTGVTDAGLKELAGLKNLSTFSVNFTQVSDAGLKHLAGCKKLTILGLATKHIGDAGLKEFAGLTDVTTLFLGGTQVTDAGVKHLAGFKELNWLVLGGTRITDAALKDLARHKKLNWLVLGNTKITDAGVKELAALSELTEIFLDRTEVSDAGLKELVGLTKLRAIFLRGTKVTEAGVASFQKALPKCQIVMR